MHTPKLLEVKTKNRAEATVGRDTLAASNSTSGTTKRVRFEGMRERRSVLDKAQCSPSALREFTQPGVR